MMSNAFAHPAPRPAPEAADRPSLDEELDFVHRAAAGDREAFEWLYGRHVRKVHNLVYRIVGDPTEAEEVTQEVFCQAYRGLPNFHGRSRFYTWIYRIATNISLQHVQSRSRRKDRVSLEEAGEKGGLTALVASTEDPDKVVENKEFLAHLERALQQLSPNHRAVMTLGPIMGHGYEAIGEILGLTPEVVKGRLHRARERIRELMREHR